MRRPGLTGLLATLAALAVVAPASASPLDDFRRNGTIDPCRYSDGELRRDLNGLPPDVQQYAPGLADQLSAGREGCGVGGGPGAQDTRQLEAVPGPGSAGGGGGGGAQKAKVPAPPAPTPDARVRLADLATPPISATASGSDAPGWLLPLLLGLGALAALMAVARVRGSSAERITRPLGASFADAGARTADAFAELWDSVRLGR